MLETVIVVPCYNEEARLSVDAFLEFSQTAPDIGFLFVNDGSRDGTESVLRRMCDTNRAAFSFMTLDRNSGKAEAVRRGMLRAIGGSETRFAGFWDADLATPLEAIREFREVLDARPHTLMVMGARVRLLGRYIERRAKRHYLGRVFATVVSLVLALPVYDTQCGAKLLRATPLTKRLFEEPFLSRWIFDVEILARLSAFTSGAAGPGWQEQVYELPLKRWNDVRGSKLRPRDYLIAVLDMFRIGRKYLAYRPRRLNSTSGTDKKYSNGNVR